MSNYILFRAVPTMRCNYRCNYCFVSPEEKCTTETMFDQHAPEEWVRAMKNFDRYQVEFYFWGGEPFLLDGTCEIIRGWTQYSHVINGSRIDTNMAFTHKIAERCPTDKVKLNCSWHTQYDSLDRILEKVKKLNDLGMVGMTNFVASRYNLRVLQDQYHLSIAELIKKFEDIGVFLNVAADFSIVNDKHPTTYADYKRMILNYLCPEDWRQLRCEKSSCFCEANRHYFTIHANGDITPCLSGQVCGNFFQGTLNFPKPALCDKQCPSLVSYCFRTDNNFPYIRHLVAYVNRNREYRKSICTAGVSLSVPNPDLKGTDQASSGAMPFVSIVLPTYNHLKFLPNAVDSILAQTYEDFELIIVDDGSTDASADYLDGLNDPRVRVTHQQNKRLPEALNTGFRMARGELLTWISADNYCAPVFLEKIVSAMDRNPSAGLAYSAFARIDDKDRIVDVTRCSDMDYKTLLLRFPGMASFMYRRTCQQEVGLYDPSLEGAEDWDMWLRIAERFPLLYVPDVLYYYRRHDQSLTASKSDLILKSSLHAFENALGRLHLENLYPRLRHSQDHSGVEFDALLDFGTSILRSKFRANTDAACRFLSKALSLRPDSVEAAGNLAIAYALRRQWENVLPLVKRMAKEARNPTAQSICRSVLQAYRTNEPKALSSVPLFEVDKNKSELFETLSPAAPHAFSEPSVTTKTPAVESEHERDTVDTASDCFLRAAEELDKGNFEPAAKYMQKYRTTVDYSKFPRTIFTSRRGEKIDISVIVVTYNRSQDLVKCLESLSKQDAACSYEVIVVDNGTGDIEGFTRYADQYVKCPINLVLSEGRNVGACCAKGTIIAFLDDDAVVPSDYISSIKTAFETYDIFGLRGRALPKTNAQANKDAAGYDRGDKPFVTFCDLEGNSAFLRDVYLSLNGMDPLLFGHEGSDLTYRITEKYDALNKIIYWPNTVIYHDSIQGLSLDQKAHRYRLMTEYLNFKHGSNIFGLRKTVESQPLPEKKSQPLTIDEQVVKVKEFLDRGHVVAALKEYENILAISMDNLDALVGRALCLVRLGRLLEAEVEAANALRSDPENIDLQQLAEQIRRLKPDLKGDRDIEWNLVKSQIREITEAQGRRAALLDFGCGQTAELTRFAAGLGHQVTAIDMMPLKVSLEPAASSRFIQGDFLRQEWAPKSFDLIINCSSIEHAGLPGRYGVVKDGPDDDLKIMARMQSLIKADGRMLLTVPVGLDAVVGSLHRVYGQTRLSKLLEGWDVESSRFWIKDENNQWREVDSESALQREPMLAYGIGSFILRPAAAVPEPTVQLRQGPAIASQTNKDGPTALHCRPVPKASSSEIHSTADYPKVSFGIIVLNGEPFTKYCLRALYPFAHEIIVVEGASEKAKALSTPDGHSRDDTLRSLQQFKETEDTENKLKIITRDGFWSEKDEQSQAYAQIATGDYLWQVDIDEFYMPRDIDCILKRLKRDLDISAVSFKQLSFWGDLCYKCDSTYLLKGGDIFHRLFKFGNGYRYVTHRPPTVVDPQGVDLRKKKYLTADMMASEGIYLYHYSLLFPKQVHDKVTYYKNLPGEQCPGMLKWAMNNYHHISNPYRIYNVHTFPGWLERYKSKHPPQVHAMVDDIRSGRLDVQTRDNADVESFIDDPKYHTGIELIKTEFQRRPNKTLKITDTMFEDASFREFVNHKTLNVAQFNSGESRGGACRISMDLSQWLIDNGCRVTKYVGNKDAGNPWVARIFDDELDNRLKDVCQKAGLLDYHIQSTFNLLTDTGLFSHDLFHFHNLHGGYFNPFALVLLARLKPSLWTLHDMQPLTGHCAHSFECEKWRTGCGQCPNLPIYPAILKDSTAQLWRDKKNVYEAINIDLVTPSHWLKSKVEKSILGDKRVRVIPNGIDPNVFRPTEKKLARQLLKMPQDRIVLAFAASGGLTNPWKGGKYLYEALRHLSTRYPDLLLLNIGGTVNIKDCRVVNVPFIKQKKDLAVVYSACDIFAYPAVAETFGLVVLEALACGLPVVTFNTGGIPEIVEHGKNGIVAEYKNQSEFIKALELLIDNTDLRNQFSRYAAANIRSIHSVEAMSSAYLNLYLELIYENKSPSRRAGTCSVAISADRLKPRYSEFEARLLEVGNTLGAEAFKAEAEKTEAPDMVSPSQAHSPAGIQAEPLHDKNQDSTLSPVSRGESSYFVSAIVSTYNSERFIRGCLQDLENQTIADRLQIIVVNSGSQQNEEAVVREFQSRYDNIKYIKTQQRETIYKAWNRAVKAASGRYITTANADDRHTRDAFEKMVNALDANPNKILVYADQIDVSETGGQRIEIGKRLNGPFSRERLFKGECPPGSQPMWRADVHNRVGYFDEAFAISGDYEFWFRLTQKCDFLYLNEFLGERLVDPEAVSRTNSDLLNWENMVIDKCYRYALHESMEITDTGLSNHPDFRDWPEVNIWRQRVRAKLNCRQVSLANDVKNVWDCRTNTAPKVTVVLVTYARRPELFEALDSLNGQTEKDFEVIVVANDGDLSELKQKAGSFDFGLCGIEFEHNYGPSPARNKGSEFAKAPYIAFMDDDAVADENLLRNIVAHFQGTRASGLRGKVLPKSKDCCKQVPANYDLGDKVIPTACEVSSLSAYRKDVFAEARGFDELLFGPEGVDLSYRICKTRAEKTKSILYFPDVVVYHDPRAAGLAQTEKILRRQWMDLLAWRKDPDIRGYRELVRSLYPAGCDAAVENNYAWIVNVAMCLEKNFPQDAVKWARKANALRPDGVRGCYVLGGLCVRLGEYDQARVVLERILQPLQQALADGGSQLLGTEFESRNEIAECCLRTCTQLAQCYLHDNAPDKVKRIYGSLLDNPHLTIPPEQQARIRAIMARLDRTPPSQPALENKGAASAVVGSQDGYLVSAIVSTYNAQEFLSGCMDDLQRQTIADRLEIIVVNSGSQQNEEAIVRRYQQKYDNIVYIKTEQREGIYSAWNRAVKVARGQFLTNANTDDRHRHDALEIMARTLQTNPDTALVYGDQIRTDTPNDTFANHHGTEMLRRPDYSRERLLLGCCVGSQPMWRKSLHDEFGYFDESLDCAGDWDFWIRISGKYQFRHIPEFIGLYYYNQDGIEHGRKIHSLYERYIVGRRYGTEYIAVIPYCKPKPGDPLVSVVMPVHNGAKYIDEAIESVLIQSYPRFELIIVDDGSTDATRDVVARFEDERIKYIYKENGGPSSARNLAIKDATGEYIMPLDADDMMTPDFIVRHLQQFQKHPQADLVYCDVLLIDGAGKPIKVMQKPEYQDRSHLAADLFRAGHPIIPFRLGIRKSVFDKIGLYDESLTVAEDYDMIRRFVKAGLNARHLAEPLHLRRMHPDSLCRGENADRIRNHFDVIQRFIETFAPDELFPDAEWDRITPQLRPLHAKCRAAVILLEVGRAYLRSNAPAYAQAAFKRACTQLKDCLSMDPANQRIRQMLQKCERVRTDYENAARKPGK